MLKTRFWQQLRGMQANCRRYVTNSIIGVMVVMLPSMAAGQFAHDAWHDLLNSNVHVIDGGQATQVNYTAMARDSARLQAYLGDVASVSRQTFDNWSTDDQLAFLINTYNAATVALVLTEYPDIDSIRDIGSLFQSAWSRPFVSLFGQRVTLDEIEHDMIRGWGIYKEPRIHFAVNCAAIGCPPLRAEAYIGARLDEQLDDNVRLFLADRTRNYADGNRLYISKIFDWYEEDFEKGWQGINSVSAFLSRYQDALNLTPQQAAALTAGRLSLRYLRYDWGLNSTQ